METLNVVTLETSTNVPPSITLTDADMEKLSKSKVGRVLLQQWGVTEQEPERTHRVRREVPEGQKFCSACYKRGLAQEMNEDEAAWFATKPETEFTKSGKNEDGSQKYGPYCKTDTNLRSQAHLQKHANASRIKLINEKYLPNAEARVLELKVELESLTSANAITEAVETDDVTVSTEMN